MNNSLFDATTPENKVLIDEITLYVTPRIERITELVSNDKRCDVTLALTAIDPDDKRNVNVGRLEFYTTFLTGEQWGAYTRVFSNESICLAIEGERLIALLCNLDTAAAIPYNWLIKDHALPLDEWRQKLLNRLKRVCAEMDDLHEIIDKLKRSKCEGFFFRFLWQKYHRDKEKHELDWLAYKPSYPVYSINVQD